ncbi:hypothetical protein EON76_03045 [bacterium]|nr:MAG: hypothetical protein EON76_03045 [bacterium]
MSTEIKPAQSSANDYITSVLEKLDSLTMHLPVSQLLAELQIIVERLNFSMAHNKGLDGDDLVAEIDLLFQGELNDGVLEFVRWLARENKLTIVTGRPGQLFLDHCIKLYERVTEVHFITAVDLHENTRRHISARLDTVYTEPHRVIFDVMPKLVAGFVIRDGSVAIDRSLKTLMTRKVRERVHRPRATTGIIHG